MRDMAPFMPGLIMFGLAVGAAFAQKGMSTAETALSSAVVFAGLAQMVALEGWTSNWTVPSLLAVGLITFTVNLRHLLMGAAMRPWLAPLPPARSYPLLLLMSDNNWAASMRYHAQGGSDAGHFLGAGLLTWVVWLLSTVCGQVIGGDLPDPRAVGFDLVMPAFFVAMLVPNWRGRREAVSWSVAGTVAVAVSYVLPGWWFIMIGALSGAVAGGFVDDRRA